MRSVQLLKEISFMLRRLERVTALNTFPELGMLSYPLSALRTLVEFVTRSFLLLVRGQGSLQRLRSIGHSMQGRSLVVLANGPSLRRLDAAKVAAKMESAELSLMVMNNFFRTELSKKLTPSFYLLSDPLHRPDSLEPVAKQLWTYLSKSSEVVIFVPRHWTSIPPAFAGRVIYFEDRSLEGISRNISPLRPRGYVSLTAFKALSLGLHLGFDRLYLCGYDSDLFKALEVDESNRLIQKANHAKGGATQDVHDVSKFFPNGVADYFFDIALTAFQMKKLFRGRPVTNLDKDSITDAFEKSDPLGLMIRKVT